MRSSRIILSILSILGARALTQRVSSQSLAQSKPIGIAASAVLNGKSHVLHDTRVVIDGSKIVAIDPKAGPVDYDLRGLTVLAGWIDVHVHIGWFFGKDGKLAGAGATPEEAAYAAACNACHVGRRVFSGPSSCFDRSHAGLAYGVSPRSPARDSFGALRSG